MDDFVVHLAPLEKKEEKIGNFESVAFETLKFPLI